MRIVLKSFSVLAVSLGVIMSAAHPAAAAAPQHIYSSFYEFSDPTMYGVHAGWHDEDWSGIACPDDHSHSNRVNTFVNVQVSSTDFLQVGYKENKEWNNGNCQHFQRYYAEWQKPNFYHEEYFSTPSPIATREYSLNRSDEGCAAGIDWCWHFRIDGSLVTEKICCGGDTSMSSGFEVSAQVECIFDDPSSNDCPASGLVAPINQLTYKPSPNYSGTWPDWAGKDGCYVQNAHGARGVWNSATSFDAAMNVSVGGTCP